MKSMRLLCWCLTAVACLTLPATAVEYSPPSSDPQELFVFGEHVYFSAEDGIHGRELWRCDLRGKAELVADVTPGAASSLISRLSRLGDLLLFRVDPLEGDSELWRTDGTSAGTLRIAQFHSEPETSPDRVGGMDQAKHPKRPISQGGLAFDGLCGISMDGRAFIRVVRESYSFWITDGTAEGTRPCTLRTPDGADILVEASGILHSDGYFYFGGTHPSEGPGLFRCTPAGDAVETVAMLEAPASKLTRLDDRRFLFTGAQGGKGLELFVYESDLARTSMLVDIAQGPESSWPSELALVVRDRTAPLIVFTATDNIHGTEPWITDGTLEGTRMIADVFPGAENSQPYNYRSFEDRITFVARNSEVGKEIWASSRPFTAVVLLGDLFPGPRGADPYDLCVVSGNKTTFSALDPELGEEFFVAKASSNEAVLQRDIYPGPQNSSPYWAVKLGEQVVFAATDPVHGRELWCADANGDTRLLADLYTDASVNPSASPHSLTPAGQLLFFVANDIVHGAELWVSNGNGAGTRMVKDIFPGSASSAPQELTAAGDLLYFTAEAESGRNGLWSSDGTAEGTVAAELDAESPAQLLVIGSTLFFSAHSPEEGRELWVKNLKQAPRLVLDLCPGACSSTPRELASYQETLYFLADDGVHGEELWRSDGTAAGTLMIRDIASVPFEPVSYQLLTPMDNILFAVATTASHGTELWRLRDEGQGPQLVKDISAWDALRPR